MKFTTNLKPIAEGIELAIINGNVGKYYQKSHITEINILEDGMQVNTESDSIRSELRFDGKVSKSGDGDTFTKILVDSKLLKKLLNTLSAETVSFTVTETHLELGSGKSKFDLPQVDVPGSDGSYQLARPGKAKKGSEVSDLNPEEWEFVRRNQKYALSLSTSYPVYMSAWIGGKDGIITGDYGKSLFTHTYVDALDEPCLVRYTILNLLSSMPKGSTIVRSSGGYLVRYESDPFTFTCEFSPEIESDDFNYNADIILGMFDTPAPKLRLETEKVRKLLSQAELFTAALYFGVDSITLAFDGKTLRMFNVNVSCEFDMEFDDAGTPDPFEADFDLRELKSVISHISDMKEEAPDIIDIRPLSRDDDGTEVTYAIRVETDYISTCLGAIE